MNINKPTNQPNQANNTTQNQATQSETPTTITYKYKPTSPNTTIKYNYKSQQAPQPSKTQTNQTIT